MVGLSQDTCFLSQTNRGCCERDAAIEGGISTLAALKLSHLSKRLLPGFLNEDQDGQDDKNEILHPPRHRWI